MHLPRETSAKTREVRFRTGLSAAITASLLMVGGCATRPINPPIQQADAGSGYRFETRQAEVKDKDALVILAFSGGGTRAAAFSYGVLDFLRRTEIVAPNGAKFRLIDSIGVITGVSGGSFTALAYGLFGDKLFDDYEQRFLKRDVQGELISRALKPANWDHLNSTPGSRDHRGAPVAEPAPAPRAAMTLAPMSFSRP